MKTRLFLLLAFCVSFSVHVIAQSSWQDEANRDTSWWGKNSGKEYVITSAKQLAGVAYLVNNGFTTFADTTLNLIPETGNTIDLSAYNWVPIGNSEDMGSLPAFQGRFEGNNNIIKGLKRTSDGITSQYLGFFGSIVAHKDTAWVKNLILEDGSIQGSETSTLGVLTGNISAMDREVATVVIIENCHTKNISIENGYISGGLIGEVAARSPDTNYSKVIVRGCSNTGKIAGTGGGGIIGRATSSLSGIIHIKHCSNTGAVIGEKEKESKLNYNNLGGILGGCDNNDPGTIILHDCFNSGDITIEESEKKYIIGGIIGEARNISNTKDASLTISNCYNTGAIKVNDKNALMSGGIIGRIHCPELNTGHATFTVSNCLALPASLPTSILTHRIIGNIDSDKKGEVILSNNYANVSGIWNNPDPSADNENGADWTVSSGDLWTAPIDTWDFTNIWTGDASPTGLPTLKPYVGKSSESDPDIFKVVISLETKDPVDEGCLTIIPVTGTYRIVKDTELTLRALLGDDCDKSDLRFVINGDTITPELRSVDYLTSISVKEDMEIKVVGVKDNGIGVEEIQINPTKVCTTPGHIVIEQQGEGIKEKEVRIYTITGSLIHRQNLTVGTTMIPLQKGTYVVVAGNKIAKVVL